MTMIELDDQLAARLGESAKNAGVTLEAYVVALLGDLVRADEATADQQIVDEFLATGEAIPSGEVVAWLKAGGRASGAPFPKPRRVT